jgi:cytochrome b involved in lipid metabolism
MSLLLILFIVFILGLYHKYFSDTREQLIENNESDSSRIIVTYKGSKYDITDFVSKHPGGKTVLIENKGKDVEKLMADNDHSANAYKILNDYKI